MRFKIDGYRAQVHSRDERRPGLKRRHDWSTGWSDQGSSPLPGLERDSEIAKPQRNF
jgi:hypothetical protein